MPFCLLHPQPRAFRHPVPPHIVRNFARGIRNPSGRSRTAPESGVPARRQIPQPSRLEKSGLLNQKEGKETWFEVT